MCQVSFLLLPEFAFKGIGKKTQPIADPDIVRIKFYYPAIIRIKHNILRKFLTGLISYFLR